MSSPTLSAPAVAGDPTGASPTPNSSRMMMRQQQQQHRESTDMSRLSQHHHQQPNGYFHASNAADGRKMRRIIAEDPEWNLMTVPLLSELCTKAIVRHFETHPRHDELPLKHQRRVIQQIPTSLPLHITAGLIDQESYWMRCCRAKYRVADVSRYGNSWKRMFFERELQAIIESFVPNRSERTRLAEILRLGAPYVVRLDIRQLLPPVELEKKEFSLDNEEDDDPDKDELRDKSECAHFDFGTVIPHLPRLEELRVAYGVRDCGMNFEWPLFDFTKTDCQVLARCVAQCATLRSLHINWSKLDDDKLRLFVSQILDHPALVELDLAHNVVSDRGCRAIGKLLNGHSRLERLNLCNNQVRAAGAQAIAHALLKNSTLQELNLRLNRLGDEGGQAIAKALIKNCSLTNLNLASNNMTEPTAALISGAIEHNKTLKYMDLSSNRLGPDGGKQIQEAMRENETLIELDLRLTDCGQESEYIINQILKRNYENDRNMRIESQNRSSRVLMRTHSHIF